MKFKIGTQQTKPLEIKLFVSSTPSNKKEYMIERHHLWYEYDYKDKN